MSIYEVALGERGCNVQTFTHETVEADDWHADAVANLIFFMRDNKTVAAYQAGYVLSVRLREDKSVTVSVNTGTKSETGFA